MSITSAVLNILMMAMMISCVNSTEDIRSFSDTQQPDTEVTKGIELLYSDSAKVKVRLTSPIMIKVSGANERIEKFPEGIHVEFLSASGRVNSYMDARMAKKDGKQGIIIASDSVVVYNKQGDKLETNLLTWNENTRSLYNNRFVRITRPQKRDTIYGFGISADQDFARFEIKQVLGKSTFEKLTKSL